MDLGSALVALLTALVVKLGVLVLGARLLLKLYRAQDAHAPRRLWILLPKEDKPEVRILWWSVVLFFASELTCGVEVYVIFRSNVALSSFHGLVSAVAMGLFGLGLYLVLDKKVFHFGAKRCVVNGICRGCTIDDERGCKFALLLTLVATFVALAAIYPLFTSTERLVANPTRYILPFESLNSWYDSSIVPWLLDNVDGYDPTGEAYFIPESVMYLEFRVLPVIALLASVVSIALLRTRRVKRGLHWLAFAFGFLCYPYFELILLKTTDDLILGSLGHEIGEFWFLLAAAELLRVTFDPTRAAGKGGASAIQVAAAPQLSER